MAWWNGYGGSRAVWGAITNSLGAFGRQQHQQWRRQLWSGRCRGDICPWLPIPWCSSGRFLGARRQRVLDQRALAEIGRLSVDWNQRLHFFQPARQPFGENKRTYVASRILDVERVHLGYPHQVFKFLSFFFLLTWDWTLFSTSWCYVEEKIKICSYQH